MSSSSPSNKETVMRKVPLFSRMPILPLSVTVPASIILLIILLALLVPIVSPYDALRQNLTERLSAPGTAHILGTDALGRDCFTRIFYGTRISLFVALIPTAFAVLIGMAAGIAAAFFGKAADALVTWLSDVTLAFPGMLLAMVIMYSFGGSFSSIVISIVIMEWGSIARIVRSVTLSILENEYILAARSIGVKRFNIIIRHIIPNLIPTLIVLFTLNIPASILSESSLSFLGIGIQPPEVSLGLMVNESRTLLFNKPHLVLGPAGMIMLLVLSFNFLGDALRDRFDQEV